MIQNEEVEENGVEVDKSTENEVDENGVARMYDLQFEDSAEPHTSLMGPHESGMKQKNFLPPGSWYDMFLMYKGSRLARHGKTASFSTSSVR